MKKILYLYGTLLFTFIQAFLWFCLLYYIFFEVSVSKNIAPIFVFAMPLLFSIWLDSKIRDFNEWYMFIVAFLASPVRFILQIITIIFYYKGGKREDFAKRGDFMCIFPSWIMYVLFSTEYLSAGGKLERKTKAMRPAPEPNPTVMVYNGVELDSTTIVENKSRHYDINRFNHIKQLKGNLQNATVYILGFINWTKGWQSFDAHGLSSIAHVYVNDVDFVFTPVWNEGGKPGIGGDCKLFLPKGTYTIKIEYQIIVPETDFPGLGAGKHKLTNEMQSDSITITITDETTPKFIGVFSNIKATYDYSTNNYGIKSIYNVRFKMNSFSNTLTREKAKELWGDDNEFEFIAKGQSPSLSF